VYAYAHRAGWLGSVSVFSSEFVMLSSWSFICIFAANIFFEPFRLIQLHASANANARGKTHLASLLAGLAVAALGAVIVVKMLANPYGARAYRTLVVGAAAFGLVWLLATELIRTSRRIAFGPLVVLSISPSLALVHLSLGIRQNVPTAHTPSLRNYLLENASIALEKPFRGYAATICSGQRVSVFTPIICVYLRSTPLCYARWASVTSLLMRKRSMSLRSFAVPSVPQTLRPFACL